MQKQSLDGGWKLKHYPKHDNAGDAFGMDFGDTGWFDANVPGDVHLDMMAAGILEDPLYGANIRKCGWLEKKQWIYRKKFVVPPGFIKDRVELVFEGLDLNAQIWLNGAKTASHSNAFRECRIDVTRKLLPGGNTLALRLECGIELAEGKPLKKYAASPGHSLLNERLWLRKPQYTFGWGWSPKLLTCGIWRPVSLVSYETAAIRNVFVLPEIKGKSALCRISAEIENFTGRKIILDIDTCLENGSKHPKRISRALSPGINTVKYAITVKNPRLWWPAPLGKPELYDFRLELSAGGRKIDEYTDRIGIREVRLLQEPLPGPEGGKSFTFEVNGRKVFCKGANWVPADPIPARIKKERYEELVKLAAGANFNMFRVWGGGIYEDRSFYRACDEHGIMVWQDFMYACSLYPDDDRDFVSEITKESAEIVKKLRNHPSIVLWCGNNENDWHYDPAPDNLFKGAKKFYGGRIYHGILPEACGRYDGSRPYWPSSPWGGENPNSEAEGDHHFYFISSYGGGHLKSPHYRDYGKINAKFMSEYSVMGPANWKSIKKSMPEKEIRKASGTWKFKLPYREFDARRFLSRWFPGISPGSASLESSIALMQFAQGEILRYSIEHFRRRKFNCGGTLFWMYGDCWLDILGHTIVDCYLGLKPAYYYVRRAYSPVDAVIKEEDYGVSVWIVNDKPENISGEIECGLMKFDGEAVRKRKKSVYVRANSSVRVFSDSLEYFGKNVFYYVKFKSGGKIISQNRHFFVDFRDLVIPETGLKTRLRAGKRRDESVLEIKSSGYALMVSIDSPDGLFLSDNFFDIFPGETAKVSVRGRKELLKKLKISALNNYLSKAFRQN